MSRYFLIFRMYYKTKLRTGFIFIFVLKIQGLDSLYAKERKKRTFLQIRGLAESLKSVILYNVNS